MARQKASSAESKLKQGRGQGHGENYKPYLTVRDVPSHGLSHRIKGWITNRVHQFLSNLERDYFYVLEWSFFVADIREQYPLPLEETLAIAERLGIRHPTEPRTNTPAVMTTDFLVDRNLDGRRVLEARAVKMSSDLAGKRTLEKLEIERTYWAERKVDWGIVTEMGFPLALAKNVDWIHSAAGPDNSPGLTLQLIAQVEKALFARISGTPRQPLAHAALAIDQALGLEPGSGLWVVRHCIATRLWVVDMFRPILTDQPLRVARNAEIQTRQGERA